MNVPGTFDLAFSCVVLSAVPQPMDAGSGHEIAGEGRGAGVGVGVGVGAGAGVGVGVGVGAGVGVAVGVGVAAGVGVGADADVGAGVAAADASSVAFDDPPPHATTEALSRPTMRSRARCSLRVGVHRTDDDRTADDLFILLDVYSEEVMRHSACE